MNPSLAGLKGLKVSKRSRAVSNTNVYSGVKVNVPKQNANSGLKTWQWLLIAGVGLTVVFGGYKMGKK